MTAHNNKWYLRRIAVLGIMTALAAICSLNFPLGLTVRVGDFMKLSPTFLIVGIVGNMYGWKEAALVSFLSDLLQSLIFGGFSPFISLAAILNGLCFGLMLKNTKSIPKIVISVLLTQLIVSLIIVTSVLCFQYGMPFIPLIYFRLLQTAIMVIIEIPLLIFFIKILDISGKIKKIAK